MRVSHTLTAVDAHAGGDPMRILTTGCPPLQGATVAERMAYFQHACDWVRRALLHEPRGHADMMGAVLTAPARPDAHFGVFYMHSAGYLPMCGHGTLALVTALADLGWIESRNGSARIVLDTPVGLVEAEVSGEGEERHAEVVSVAAAPLALDVRLLLRNGETVTADVAYAGNVYLIVEAGQVGLSVGPESLAPLKQLWVQIRETANRHLRIRHPLAPERFVEFDVVQFWGPPRRPEAHARNVVICSGQVSRSPCGTGTCARAAVLWGRGQLQIGQEFANEGMAGEVFRVRPVAPVELGGLQGLVPLLIGRAHVTGLHQFLIDPVDPFRYGIASS